MPDPRQSLISTLLHSFGNQRPAMRQAIKSTDRLALLGLIAANVIPIVLAMIFGWNIGDVVLFYWWENLVIGLYALLRILTASSSAEGSSASRFFIAPFFTFHYFFFCFIHVIFLRLFFQDGGPLSMMNSPFISSFSDVAEMIPQAGLIGLIALVLSHGLSYFQNYIGRGEYRSAIPIAEMFRPYGRIVLMHLCVLLGGFAVSLFGSPMVMVLLLMIGKTCLDVVSHSVSHAKLETVVS